MVIYVDVLLFTNTILNYAILMTTEKLLKRNCRLYRILLGAFAGAVFSLSIFIHSDSRIFLFFLKIICSAVITIIAFGWKSRAEYSKAFLLNIVISLLYCGFLILFYQIFKPPNMLIVNDVVYLHLNPLLLMGLTAVIYILVLLLYKLFFERIKSTVVSLQFILKEKNYSCIAKIDTGCHLREPFSSAPVIVVDTSVFSIKNEEQVRVIPYTTINGSSYLYAVKADSVLIDKKPVTQTIYIASGNIHNPNYQAIINSDITR